jgi:hypothetical protein
MDSTDTILEKIIRHSKSIIEDKKALNRRLAILEEIKISSENLIEISEAVGDNPEANRLLEKGIRSIKRYIEEKNKIENQLLILNQAEELNKTSINLLAKLQRLDECSSH